ncbi:AbrB/MazE/SpoVT family DNA-binding domain-containing protein [Halomicroarcula sp. GCM10025817]|uniref:AbrB/MazE/SpoVT family DNA-binding domain-containing protein n=1 Tax=Haloarcula TaxID=2237 RepID=UPI0023E7C633|nr:AbrB/MazE/SpoVT family DNA-binding domain-containing protein [Halomicroarcula sp. SYNS111]
MGKGERRKIGERGQVTIPKELRERFGIKGGDDVVIHEEAGKIIIERSTTREELAEGYRQRAQRTSELADELEDVSTEANEHLGDAPEW